MAKRAGRLSWVSLAAVALLWWGSWKAAGAAVEANYRTAAHVLMAVDARSRRRRARNMAMAAPLLATVFNLLGVAVVAPPAAALDPQGTFGAHDFLLSAESSALLPGYLDFCAVAAFVSMAGAFMHSTLAPDVGPGHMAAAVAASSTAWGACGAVAAAFVLKASGWSARAVLLACAAAFAVVAANGGLAARRAESEAEEKQARAPRSWEVPAAVAATGALALAGARAFSLSGTWVPWAAGAAVAGAAVAAFAAAA
jgi:hypothetical protein